MVFSPVVLAGVGPAETPITPQLTELFWALFLLVAFVLVGIIWAGIIRRNVRQRTETILRREAALEEHYRELFENAHDIIFTHDLEGHLTSLNKAGEQILGYSREEAVGLEFARLVAPGQHDSFRQILGRLNDGLINASCELQMRAKDGRRVVIRQPPVVFCDGDASFIDPSDGGLVEFSHDHSSQLLFPCLPSCVNSKTTFRVVEYPPRKLDP